MPEGLELLHGNDVGAGRARFRGIAAKVPQNNLQDELELNAGFLGGSSWQR
jgi:hypothetical protein